MCLIISALNLVSRIPFPGLPQVLTPGTTHVAVGFVDLGDLASACMLLKGADLKTKPLRYFKYGDLTGNL